MILERLALPERYEATHWDALEWAFETKRINHSLAYSFGGGTHTNWVESYFSRLRKMIDGQHHWVSPKYLYQYAEHAAWIEDHRKEGLLELSQRIIASLTIFIIYFIHLSSIKWPAEQQKRDHWEQQAKTSPKNFQLICPPSENGKPIPAEKCERSGYYEYDREQQILDHDAQSSMRTAAWVTAVLTGFGLFLIGITLWQAFKAAGLASKMLNQANTATHVAIEGLTEAKRATHAANKTTAVTRDMGVAQTRAYISIKRVAIWVHVLKTGGLGWQSNNKGNFHFTIQPVFENTGNTPAYNVSYKFKISLLKNNKHLLRSGFGESSSFGVVGHKSDTSKGPVYMVGNNVPVGNISSPIEAKGIRCWITIRAEYSDVFDNRWYVESIFEGNPAKATGMAGNVKDLMLRHQTASDKHGKI